MTALMTPEQITSTIKLDKIGRALCCLAAAINGSMAQEGLPTTETVYQSTPIRWPDCDGMFIVTGFQSQSPDPASAFSSDGLATCVSLRETVLEFVVGYCRPESIGDNIGDDENCTNITGTCPSCNNVPELEESCDNAHDWTTHSWQLMRSLNAINRNVCSLFGQCMRACDPIASCQRITIGTITAEEQGRFVALRGTLRAVLV